MYFLFVRCGFFGKDRFFYVRTHGHTYIWETVLPPNLSHIPLIPTVGFYLQNQFVPLIKNYFVPLIKCHIGQSLQQHFKYGTFWRHLPHQSCQPQNYLLSIALVSGDVDHQIKKARVDGMRSQVAKNQIDAIVQQIKVMRENEEILVGVHGKNEYDRMIAALVIKMSGVEQYSPIKIGNTLIRKSWIPLLTLGAIDISCGTATPLDVNNISRSARTRQPNLTIITLQPVHLSNVVGQVYELIFHIHHRVNET
jgi:hypothetical protein